MEKLDRILYAEDSENDIELTLAAFQECKLANPIDVVRDGEEVLDYLFFRGAYTSRSKDVPLFILLDLKMPKLDGGEVLKEVRKSQEYKNTPVIILTSSKMESDVVKSYELGANGYVVKPIEFSEFVETIKGLGYFWGILNITPTRL
jgi:CheY-like chemotaxis protein